MESTLLHVVPGRADRTAYTGHLLEATVRRTVEAILVETPRHVLRRFDAATGLPLIDFSA